MAQPSILVLEDDEIIRSLMVDVLEDFGAVVTSFPSADEGMISRCPACSMATT
jgi:CheY-like chemotaxis protein